MKNKNEFKYNQVIKIIELKPVLVHQQATSKVQIQTTQIQLMKTNINKKIKKSLETLLIQN